MTLTPGRKADRYVIHRHAAWLCLALTFAAGIVIGFGLGALVVLGHC